MDPIFFYFNSVTCMLLPVNGHMCEVELWDVI
jgi:hypothetical protein